MLKLAMEIKYLGNEALLIKSKKESILVNPEEGLRAKKMGSRVVVYGKGKGGMISESEEVVIAGPGEYEVGGVEIVGFGDGEGGTFYTIATEGLTVGILGKLTEVLADKKAEKIAGVDILAVNIKNGGGPGPKALLQLAKKWGANYVVPTGYGEKDELKRFLDEADDEGLEPIETLKANKDDLPDGMEIVVLSETKI